MTAFIAVAVLLALAALAFLLPPLLVASPAEAPAGPPERAFALALGLLCPLLAAGTYFATGTPSVLAPREAEQRDPSSAHTITPEQINAMVSRLAARLKDNPDDGSGWAMLARSYTAISRFQDALTAFEQAATRLPRDAQLLADYADVAAMAQGRRLQGRPEAIIARALEADPNNLKALSLSGTAAFERGDYAGSIAQWRRVLALVPADSPVARSVRGSIADAERRSGGGPVLEGRVRLAKALAAQVRPDDTVFVYARAAEGGRIPLAMQRARVRDLPLAFRLDDSMAMNPQARLSSASRVVVVARVSRSGSATVQPGDLEGLSAVLEPSARGLEVEISAPASSP